MSDFNPYEPMNGTVERVITETSTIKTIVVRPEEPIPFRAGQFMQLTMPGVGEAPFMGTLPLLCKGFCHTRRRISPAPFF